MDNLRQTLKILFSELDGGYVLQSLANPNSRKRADMAVDRQSFSRLFRECDDGYSLEQAEAIYHLLEESWLQPSLGSALHGVDGKSVFNLLLVFAGEALVSGQQDLLCRYEYLMRWNDVASVLGEDILTTAFLAAKDVADGSVRRSFTWKTAIDSDNMKLKNMMSRPLADLHFHLYGSSQVFMLNWLSLMNSISGWRSRFEKLRGYLSSRLHMEDNGPHTPLYLCCIKACAIRYLLFKQLYSYEVGGAELKAGDDDFDLVMRILQCSTVEMACIFSSDLDCRIRCAAKLVGKSYGNIVIDYAISPVLTATDIQSEGRYRLSVLSGERRLLYGMFWHIYSGKCSQSLYSTLFYAYLLFKNRMRMELVQLNGKAGFANFSDYQGRKQFFIRKGSPYEILLPHLAVGLFFQQDDRSVADNRLLEVRFRPLKRAGKLAQQIEQLDRFIADSRFSTLDLLPRYDRVRNKRWNYSYILHFIKTGDRLNSDSPLSILLGPRHCDLRHTVRAQAHSIATLWSSYDKRADYIAGIDAASSEAACRPEVFGQAFRFLRDCRAGCNLEYFKKPRTRRVMGITYHVGEDFHDIVDGLRAIDEACMYLELQRGDRLGHALALGVDTLRFYRRIHNKAIMPRQIFLDNIVWLYHKANRSHLSSIGDIEYEIKQQFARLTYLIYREEISFNDYYFAWLLRGDNPNLYRGRTESEPIAGSTPWERHALCYAPQWAEDLEQARKSRAARELYMKYHFSPEVKKQGAICEEFSVSENFVRVVEAVQEVMQCEIDRAGLCVETNPTSNVRIHKMELYRNHPILRFYNNGLELPYPRRALPVSINTDDLGVFDTSIEREYSLMAFAVEKWLQKEAKGAAPSLDVYRWLDEIREMAFEQAFISK